MVDCENASWTVNVFDGGNNDLYAFTSFMDTMVYAYQWYLNGTAIPGATEALFTALENGDYSAALTDAYGCIRVSAEVSVVITGIAEEQRTWINALPNPFSDHTLIRCAGLLDPVMQLDLIDVHGRVVRTMPGSGMCQWIVERGRLPSGLYMVRVRDAQGAYAALRILMH